MAHSASAASGTAVSRSARLGQKRAALGTDLRNQVKNSFDLLLQNFASLLQAAPFKVPNANDEDEDDVMGNLMASASATSISARGEGEGNIPFTSEIERDEYSMDVWYASVVWIAT